MLRRLLLAAACLMPATAHAEWQEGSSKHFVVYSDDTPDNVRRMTADLERFDKAVRIALALKEPEVGPNARVIVFVLPDLGAVQRMMNDKTGSVGGYYKAGLPTAPIAFVPKRNSADSDRTLSPRAILQHEYTHHVMYSSFGDVVFPAWFREGFAELFATARTTGDGSIALGAIPTYRTYGIDRMNDVPLKTLLAGSPKLTDGMQVQIFYGRAWLLTHYYMFDPGRAKQLAGYIAAVNAGKSVDEADQALGVNASLDLTLNAYGARKSLPAATLTADSLKIGDPSIRTLTPGEAATMMVRMRSSNSVDARQAREVVAQARIAAAPYPNDAGAQNALAEAEYDAKNYAQADAAAGRALAADVTSVHAMIYKGMAGMALAKAAGNTDPAVLTGARRWFLAANKADPLYSYPIQLYYESFHDAGQPATKSAQNGLLYAYKLSPQNVGLRLDAARILLADGHSGPARAALEPIAYGTHGGSLTELAKRAIAALDKGGPAAAIAALDMGGAKDKADEKPKEERGGPQR